MAIRADVLSSQAAGHGLRNSHCQLADTSAAIDPKTAPVSHSMAGPTITGERFLGLIGDVS